MVNRFAKRLSGRCFVVVLFPMCLGLWNVGCAQEARRLLESAADPAPKESLEQLVTPDGSSQEAVPALPRSKEPLRVNALKTPNTSVAGIGTGNTPEDATEGRLPGSISLPYGPDRDNATGYRTKFWVAPVFCHQPTYYDDVMLEQHGHERCPPLQPILSGGRFYTGIFFTPYLAYLQPPLKDIPSAGSYRPGSCAPALRQRAPYDPGAIKVQTAATAAGVLVLQP